MELLPVVLVTLFLLGLLFGSFASVVITRLRTGEGGIIHGRSHCTTCGQILRWYHLLPVVSYLKQRGKCGFCAAPVSVWYPLLEIIMGSVFLLAGLWWMQESWWSVGFWIVILWSFVVICVYDLLYMEIPDEVSIPVILFVLVTSSLWGFPVGIGDGLLGAAIILGFFGIQIGVGHMMKKELLGLGDLRIGALMGLLLGWKFSLLALFASYVVGSLITVPLVLARQKTLQVAVPFGPFLIVGTVIALLFGEGILAWYLGFLGW